MITHGMILAAGLGTRLKPFTNEHPKALAIINGKSLLQRNIEYLQRFGIDNVIVNVHHFAEQIIEALDKNKGWGSAITISDETDAVLETGGGLKRAAWFLNQQDNFLLMNADILTDLNLSALMEDHLAQRCLATLATTNRKSSRYFLFDKMEVLCGWRSDTTGEEKISRQEKSLVQKAFSGIHVISSRIFPLINEDGKFSIVDLYLELAKDNIIRSFDHSNSKFIDVGKPESLIKAGELFE